MSAVLNEDTASIRLWQLPDIGKTAIAKVAANTVNAPTVQELAAIEEQARSEGFAVGHAEGLAAAQQDIQRQQTQLHALFEAAAQPLQTLDAQTEQAIAALATLVARRVLAAELKLSPDLVLRAVQQAAAAVPAAEHGLRVRLHPEDVALLQADGNVDRHWECVADPALARGDCVIETARSRLDARVETRLAAVADAVLGDAAESAGTSP